MTLQVFSPAADALGPMDIIPSDEDPNADVAWLEDGGTAATPDLAGISHAVMPIVARAVDGVGGLRMACQEVHR